MPAPDHDAFRRQWAELYNAKNYDQGLAAYFLRKSHEWAEAEYGPDAHFPRIVEIGAGTGVHLRYVRHAFDEYVMTDLDPFPLQDQATAGTAGRGRVVTAREDATHLSFPDDAFDRLIGAHVLEHVPHPEEVLLEWARVVRPGGALTIVLPCDPGVAWRLGRYAVARPGFIRAGFSYDYWMARDHINPINNLVSLIRYHFPALKERWLPLGIPSMDLNLFYIAHISL